MANKHQLTRDQMEACIDKGQSVLVKGVIITSKDKLPSRAELAGGDPEETATAQADITQRLKDLLAEQDALNEKTAQSPALSPQRSDQFVPNTPVFRLDQLEQATLPQLIAIAAEYQLPVETMETRTELAQAIRTKAGYTASAFAIQPPVSHAEQVSLVEQEAALKEAAAVDPKADAPGSSLTNPKVIGEMQVTGKADVPAKDSAGTVAALTPSQVEQIAQDQAPPSEAPANDLDGLTVDQLKQVAQEAGVEDFAKLNTKDKLTAAITAKLGASE